MKPRLLLVEDDPGLIELLKWHLQREAFDAFLRLAREAGLKTEFIDTSKPGAQERFNAALMEKE